MSVVMRVHIKYSPEPGFNAILKLYDRRFGTTLRQGPGTGGNQLAHTAVKEALFQNFVRMGNIGPILREIEEDTRARGFGVSYMPQDDGTPEDFVRYEANLWQDCEKYYHQEARAYAKLSSFQGKLIPQLYAHMHLAPPQDAAVSVPLDLLEQKETAQFFTAKGLLMQRIDGYGLWDLPVSPLAPPDTQEWQNIVQAAIDAAHTINCEGICMEDCSAFNVVIQGTSQKPVLVDLAQCQFREDIYAEAEESSSDEEGQDEDLSDQQTGNENSDTSSTESDWNPELTYWEEVRNSNGTFAIGAGMAKRLLTARGVKIEPKFPDYQGIIDTIRRGRIIWHQKTCIEISHWSPCLLPLITT